MDTEMADDSVAAVEFLARSQTRIRLLTVLAREQELSKDELHEQFDASRTTIQRNLSALADRGWITSSNSDYAITTAGEWVAEDFAALVETIDEATRLGPVLESIDTTTFDFDPRHVGFEVTTPDPGNPLKMVHKHTRAIQQADDIRIMLPETGVRAMKAGHERTTEEGVPLGMVVSEPVLDVFRSDPEFRDYFEDKMAADAFSLFVTEKAVPYYLGILDDEVQIGVSEDGQPRALLSTESPQVFEWAEHTFVEYKSHARRVDKV